MNDGSGDEDEDEDPFNNKFSSDDEEDFLDNTGVDQPKQAQEAMNSSDMFDSLKEDTPAKKPAAAKRKLGAKAEVVKPPPKRSKNVVNLDSSEDSPVKV